MLDKIFSLWYTSLIYKCVEGIILYIKSFQRVGGRCEPIGGYKVSLIPEQSGRTKVSCYGVPRYHGKKLVRALLRDRFYGNQGGTAN